MNKKYYKSIDETLYHEILDNGLDVYIIKKEGFANKCAYFASKFGSFNTGDTLVYNGVETKIIGGLAHFLEHRVFDYKKGNVIDLYYKLGADCNAFTTYDRTVYYFNCNDKFEECLELLLDFPTSFTMTKEAVENEKDIIVNELLMYKDDPDDKLFKGLMASLYKDHPLTLDVGGEPNEVRETTYELLKQVHESFYSPNNMVLVICGDVDVEKTMDLVKSKEFTTRELNLKKKEIDKSLSVVCESKIIEDDVNNKKLLLGYKMKPMDDLTNDDRLKVFISMDVLSSLLFSNSSEFYNMMINEKYVSSLGVDIFDYEDAFAFIIECDLLKEESLVIKKINERIENTLNIINDEKLDSVKRKEISSIINGCDSINRIARNYLTYVLDGNDFFTLIDVLKSITMEDLKRAYNEYLKGSEYAYSLLRSKSND
ncbi:MAG: insulinase family protein [Bacilli bacterium]|nr:insulinase family protein [Bacilli bacterium]